MASSCSYLRKSLCAAGVIRFTRSCLDQRTVIHCHLNIFRESRAKKSAPVFVAEGKQVFERGPRNWKRMSIFAAGFSFDGHPPPPQSFPGAIDEVAIPVSPSAGPSRAYGHGGARG